MFEEIRELGDILDYLEKRKIKKQYIKAKFLLLTGNSKSLQFKLRQPKELEVYQFRINQKYRAFGTIKKFGTKKVLIIHQISDHQDF